MGEPDESDEGGLWVLVNGEGPMAWWLPDGPSPDQSYGVGSSMSPDTPSTSLDEPRDPEQEPRPSWVQSTPEQAVRPAPLRFDRPRLDYTGPAHRADNPHPLLTAVLLAAVLAVIFCAGLALGLTL